MNGTGSFVNYVHCTKGYAGRYQVQSWPGMYFSAYWSKRLSGNTPACKAKLGKVTVTLVSVKELKH
jgi:hypothetical protein